MPQASRDRTAARRRPPPPSSSNPVTRALDHPTTTTTKTRRLHRRWPKGPLGAATSPLGTSAAEKASEARGTLELAVVPQPPAKKDSSSKSVYALARVMRASCIFSLLSFLLSKVIRMEDLTEVKSAAAAVADQGVKQFNSRLERSPFLDSAYMEQRAKALKAMRERSTA